MIVAHIVKGTMFGIALFVCRSRFLLRSRSTVASPLWPGAVPVQAGGTKKVQQTVIMPVLLFG